jgi:hypothetical protein
MARLPRYQESGLVSGDIPRLDFANLREESQGMANLGGALDRLSQFAFGEAKKEQDRVNKLTAIQVRSELEGEVQKRMAELNVKVETGQLTNFGAIQTEVQSLVGLADGLKDLDIDQANGLVTSIRTSGKALLAKSSDMIVKNYQAGLGVQINDLNKNFELNLQTELEVNPNPAAFDQRVAEGRGRVYALGVQAGNAENALKEFDAARIRARDNVLAKHFLSAEFATKPSEALAKLSTGNAGKYTELWATIPEEDKGKITQRILKQSADIYGQQEREKNLAKEAAKAEGLNIREQYFLGQLSPNQAVSRLKAIGDISPEEMKAILTGDKPGNDELNGRLESLVDQGRLGEDGIDSYAKSGAISWKQANGLKKLSRGADKDYNQAISLINARLGVPDPMTPGFRNERKLAADAKAEFISRRAIAVQNGEAFNPVETAELVIKNVKNSDTAKQIAEDRKRLSDKLDELGIRFNDNLTEDALNRMASFQKAPKRDQQRIKDLLKTVRGE